MTDGRGGPFDVNRTGERESLLPPSRSPGPPTGQFVPFKLTIPIKPILILTALALLLGLLLGSTLNSALSTNILNPTVRDQIRAKWESEITQHTGLRQRMAEERTRWDSERKTREEERLQEGKAHAILRQNMAEERTRWDAERKEWEDVRLRERREALEERRQAREKMDEEEAKRKAGIHWLQLERALHCTRYGTREYRAKLGPVGGGYDLLKACRETGVEIHGRVVKPSSCDDMGAYNGMWGVWVVDFDEAACHTFWGDFKDKGCTAPGSGLRHIEANLKNHDAADEWTAMCASTPYDFNGLHFDGATSCANWGKYGIFGFWDIEDKNCQ